MYSSLGIEEHGALEPFAGTQAAEDVPSDTHWTLSTAAIPAPPVGQNLGLEEWTRGWSDSTFSFDDRTHARVENSELAGKMTSSELSYASVVKETYSKCAH